MEEMSKHGSIGLASMKAGMDRKTGRKYVAAGTLPSEMIKARDWRTRDYAGHRKQPPSRMPQWELSPICPAAWKRKYT